MGVRASRFSPRSEEHQALAERTVCRQGLCTSIVEAVAEATASGQARFELILGPRGAGKSHLLGLVEARLLERLQGTAVVVGLPEEFHPSSLLHLLAEVLRSLPPDPEMGSVEQQLDTLAANPEDALNRAVEMIRGRLHGVPMVLAIENLDVVFEAIGRGDQQRLRAILQTQGNWSMVATSRAWAPAFSRESEPFYGTFNFRELAPLDARCCRELLVRLARQHGRDALARELDGPEGLARVQTLRHVLGGYPRAMAFIFPHLHHDRANDVEHALQELAEELTPYFQEQMSRLSPGQRPVAELLAEHWHPLSVTEISRLTFNSPSSTSTHLRHLRRDAIVRSVKLGRQKFYEISEPLYRIARAMKRHSLRAQTFLRVLHAWYWMRGEEGWMLETPALHMGDYHHQALGSVLDDLEAERWDAVISFAEQQANSGDPRMAACRLVALARSGQQERAFEELARTPRGDLMRILAVGSMVAKGEEGLERFLARDDVSVFERFCAAAYEETGSSLGFIEAVLGRLPRSSRRAVSTVLSRILLPFLQASVSTGTRLIAALAREGSSVALEMNLAMLTMRAWASNRLQGLIETLFEDDVSVADKLSPAAKFTIELASRWPENALGSFEALLAGQLGKPEYDRQWRISATVLLVERVTQEERGSEFQRWLESSSEDNRTVRDMIVQASFAWVAAGREMKPFFGVLSLVPEAEFLQNVEYPNDPDAVYARLAQPERALVRSLASVLSPQRRAVLLEIDSDDE